ncbi:protein phosphatase-1 [Hirsutella rhossiliensis]|uniref:Protein phosphatase-1 n=1 Tax=Hirsutella rhossiliensis TaxID=111463 RepID=A0A9P8SHJ6_9HYPO|nr:protein phosphatase-1 [Hirsutella rhossiliensis]KAH0962896.1 protein phosphatase-1 [Hirsutella rhossiliensis]
MVLRRRRIMYRRSRYGEKPIRTNKTVSRPKVELPVSRRQDAVTPGLADEASAQNLAPPPSIVHYAAPSATTLAADNYHKVAAPSIVSATETVALGNHGELVFPRAPTGRAHRQYKLLRRRREKAHVAWLRSFPGLAPYARHLKRRFLDRWVEGGKLFAELNYMISEELHCKISETNAKLQTGLVSDWNDCLMAAGEIICPFCLYALPSLSVSDDKKWRAHVTNDLDAYVCLFDECDREDEYLSHMREAHPSSFTEPQLCVLAERKVQPLGPMFESYPLCGTVDATRNLEDHIVGHLRFLALKSLPSFEVQGSEGSEGERGSSASRPESRTTINKDPERHIRPTFDDPDSIPTSHPHHPGSPSPYTPWGGYREYIAQRVDGAAAQDRSHGVSHAVDFMPPNNLVSEQGEQFLWHQDPSSDFVDESLFDEIQPEDRIRFEWGFLTEAGDGQLQDPENNAITRSLLKSRRKNVRTSLSVFKYRRQKVPAVCQVKTNPDMGETANKAHWLAAQGLTRQQTQDLENDRGEAATVDTQQQSEGGETPGQHIQRLRARSGTPPKQGQDSLIDASPGFRPWTLSLRRRLFPRPIPDQAPPGDERPTVGIEVVDPPRSNTHARPSLTSSRDGDRGLEASQEEATRQPRLKRTTRWWRKLLEQWRQGHGDDPGPDDKGALRRRLEANAGVANPSAVPMAPVPERSFSASSDADAWRLRRRFG